MAYKLPLLFVALGAVTARAQPGLVDPLAEPLSDDGPAVVVVSHPHVDPLATTERWGGGLRLTGESGIGALPGRSFGAEVAVNVRHDELFTELALSHWQPQTDYHVMSAGTPVPLGLDLWAVRAGWSSMRMPLRAWLLAEVGEVAGASEMPGVLPRMVMGDAPAAGRRWTAIGAGVGVAWPMSNQIRLVGTMELAVPLVEEHLLLDRGAGEFKSDPLAARYALGLEVGWR